MGVGRLGCRWLVKHLLWREHLALLFVPYIAQGSVRGWIEVYTVRVASFLWPRGEDDKRVVHMQVGPWEREKLSPARYSMDS